MVLAVDWEVVRESLFSEIVLRGVWMTVRLTFLGMAIGVVIGTIVALMRISRRLAARGVALLYIWLFRGTPFLVQVVFWFFALPQLWPGWAPWDGQLTAFQTAILALVRE